MPEIRDFICTVKCCYHAGNLKMIDPTLDRLLLSKDANGMANTAEEIRCVFDDTGDSR